MAWAPSENSDQPGHPPSLIRVFTVRIKKAWVLSYPLSAQRRLIRLGGCPGWSESLLDTQSFCWFCREATHFILFTFTVLLISSTKGSNPVRCIYFPYLMLQMRRGFTGNRSHSRKCKTRRTAKTDQTGRMPRLIWVFAESSRHLVGFVLFCFRWGGVWEPGKVWATQENTGRGVKYDTEN